MENFKHSFQITQYKHFISLGYFCSVAMELERTGLRSTSSPFDWLLCNFIGVIDAINHHFEDFLDSNYLFQDAKNHRQYYNPKYGFYFVHDFDKYRSLQDQLPEVVNKYNRRIERFYHSIVEPTLFVRYISDEQQENGRSLELQWIEEHYTELINTLQMYNPQNSILFIANTAVTSPVLKIYNVSPDENDIVARKPLEKNQELCKILTDFYYEPRSFNLNIYAQKEKRANSITFKAIDNIKRGAKKVLLHEYIHNQQFNRLE